MTDLELTTLCAEAMGVPLMGSNVPFWNPLHDDAQAMALVKKFGLHITHSPALWVVDHPTHICGDRNLNRAICECVATMQKETRERT